MGTLKRICGICQEPKCFKKGLQCFSDRQATSRKHMRRSLISNGRYCLVHASRNGYCTICGLRSTGPDPFREDADLVICRDCSLKREQWRRQGSAPA